jgi:hypothetical protein
MGRVFKVGIVLFWLVMVVLLIQRHLPESPPPALSVAPLAESAPAEAEEWMGIYHHEQKVGYLQRHLSPTDSGYTWEEQWRMRLRVLDTPQTIHTEVRAHTDHQYALTSFSFRLLSSGMTFQVSGAVEAGTLHGQIKSGGETSPFSLSLREPIYLPATTQMALRGAMLLPGEERRFTIFNPLSMRTETISITALGAETLALKGEQRTVMKVAERMAGTTVHAWLDQDGKVLKEEASLGLVLLRETQEDALGGGWQDSTPLDLVTTAAIPVRESLPNPRSLTHLQLRLIGQKDATVFAFPPRQQRHDGLLTVTTENLSALVSYMLPQADPQFAVDLQATPFLQSTHPRLVTQVKNILGTEQDALRATRKLLDWTYTTLDKTPTIGMPTALEALESKKGDCNEHAVLFTALARAAGIPARVAAGVVYLDGAFYYHAWSEVWLGQWVAVDPTFGQFPADATHVKFIEGGPEQHLGLLKVIGQVGMEVVEYK